MMDAPAAIALRREPGPLTRSLVALLLRLGLGLVFLFAGMAKLKARDLPAGDEHRYPDSIARGYPERIAFPGDVKLFMTVLPYAEVGLGTLLIGGLLTTLSGFLAGVLLLVLLFGQIYKQNAAMYPAMLTYLLVDAAILWLSPVTSNYLSLDGLFVGWFWRPKGDGEFVRDGEPPRRI